MSDQQIAFIAALAEEARRNHKARISGAAAWREGSEKSHREAHAMAEAGMGRKMPFKRKKEREALAAIDERIAGKYLADAAMLDGISEALLFLLLVGVKCGEVITAQNHCDGSPYRIDRDGHIICQRFVDVEGQ